MNPDFCPHCGEEVPEKARVCPGCGSDSGTGWSEKARYESMGIPYDDEDDFDYNEFVKRELAGVERSRSMKSAWIVAAVVLIAAFLLLWLH
jgi:hypothetical protein